jgi:hypothetical protein
MKDRRVMGSQVQKHKDPQDACLAVVAESYKAWLATEARTDDITVIVVEFELGEGLTCVADPNLDLNLILNQTRTLGLRECPTFATQAA